MRKCTTSDLALLLLSIVILLSALGCTSSTTESNKQSMLEQKMLKILLDKEIAASAQRLFNSSYDPKNGRLMQRKEIFEFLEARKISNESLPPDLQLALKENNVIGILITRLDPIPLGKVRFTPVMMSELQRFLLAWERRIDSSERGQSHGGIGAIWFGGDDECPNNKSKCTDFSGTCCGGGPYLCICVGVYKCPPCQTSCPRCPAGDPPLLSCYEGEGSLSRSLLEDSSLVVNATQLKVN